MVEDLLKQTLMQIYFKAVQWARSNKQTVGENSDYYITIAQLESILKEWIK